MKWPLRRKTELCKPRIGASIKLMELETAKEILAEIFLIRPKDVEEMIQRKLEERNFSEVTDIWPEEGREELWPAMFSVGK